MDAVLTAAARALDAGDVLAALKRVALRDDAPGLALRGIALARLGDLTRARALLRQAARAFGTRGPLGRARCLLADAEIALQLRELRGVESSLRAAEATLASQGDRANALYARCLLAQALLLGRRFAQAERALAGLAARRLPPVLAVRVELSRAELGLRTLRTVPARAALARAAAAARVAGIPALLAEVAALEAALAAPAGRLVRRAGERPLSLDEVEALLRERTLFVVDALGCAARAGRADVALAGRPVLFALLRALAEAWPDDAPRAALIARAFGAARVNESHRARLRVEIGRLRRALAALARIEATPSGFRLRPAAGREAVVLAPPADAAHGEVLTLISDGEAWSSSALALALGRSQRSVQRDLLALLESGKVRAEGRGRAQRWRPAPGAPFAAPLLLATDLVLG